MIFKFRILTIFLFTLLFQNSAISQIVWDSHYLIVWSDFQYKNEDFSEFSAYSSSSIKIEYQFAETGVIYEVRAVFNPEKSWVKDSSYLLLSHERTHFNITEVFARKIRKYLSTVKRYDDEKKVEKKLDCLLKERQNFERKYDKRTNHSLNDIEQKKFESEINSMLKSLEDYSLCCKPNL